MSEPKLIKIKNRSYIQCHCDYCGEVVNKIACDYKRSPLHFCNKGCRNGYWGALRCVVQTCKVCDKKFLIPACYLKRGRYPRYVTCSPECRSAKMMRGENHRWRGGTCDEARPTWRKEYKNWRKAVFERDDYTCRMCGERGGDKEADHIKPWAYFPELRYEVSNGRTLCPPCHKTVYGEVWKYYYAQKS